jgi:D-glycero-alpha-D-manno-heptose-7-phosphate kinase
VIISRTPFRVSLAGGGSDIAEYYRDRPGHVVSMAISRYMHVTVNQRFDDSIRVSYTRTEIVDRIDNLQHDLIREAMKLTGLTRGLEITTVADLPAGIGLGSSSVSGGVPNALYALGNGGRLPTRPRGAGWRSTRGPADRQQDQYNAARRPAGHPLPRRRDGDRGPVVCPAVHRDRLVTERCSSHRRHARPTVLADVKRRLAPKNPRASRGRHRRATDDVHELPARPGRPDGRGPERNWDLKKQMSHGVSNGHLDALYAAARKAGARGGKISGAGGGGCLCLYVPKRDQAAVRAAMARAKLREVTFGFEPEGSRIIHSARDPCWPGLACPPARSSLAFCLELEPCRPTLTREVVDAARAQHLELLGQLRTTSITPTCRRLARAVAPAAPGTCTSTRARCRRRLTTACSRVRSSRRHQTGHHQHFDVDGLRIGAFPLRRDRDVVGLIATASPAHEAQVERRAESLGWALRSALEADIATQQRLADAHRQSRWLTGTLRFLEHLHQAGDERAMFEAVVGAAAVWGDFDARVYRRELDDRYVLEACPG